MSETENIQTIIGNLYTESTKIREIPIKTAKKIGILLIQNGYQIKNSHVVGPNSEQTVGSSLTEFDNQLRYEKSIRDIIEEKGGVVGPYYVLNDDKEYCPYGIAVWLPSTD